MYIWLSNDLFPAEEGVESEHHEYADDYNGYDGDDSEVFNSH
jgi:hypothetical protein